MKGVAYKHVNPVHEDARRALIEVFNGEFTAPQLKIIKIKEDSVLGNHYHPYRQFFYMFKGSADYTFVDLITGEREDIKVQEGDFIIIDAKIAHKACHKAGNVMIEGNEQKYNSPEVDDLKFVIE